MNLLLTCAGHRNYLIEYFKEVLGEKGNVFAANSYPETTAMLAADKSFVLPQVNHPDYINILLKLCIDNDIKLIIPLLDIELPLLAKSKDAFLKQGIFIHVSSPSVVELCQDKWETYLFAKQSGINTPKSYITIEDAKKSYKLGEIRLPLILKPRYGAGSIGIEHVEKIEQLDVVYQLVTNKIRQSILSYYDNIEIDKNILIQEFFPRNEFGINVLNNLYHEQVASFALKSIEMKAGETYRAVTVMDEELIQIGRKIGNCLKHEGYLEADMIKYNDKYYLIDMNPRFGGYYPFIHMAGINIPAVLLAWYNKKEIKQEWISLKPNVFSLKGFKMFSINNYA